MNRTLFYFSLITATKLSKSNCIITENNGTPFTFKYREVIQIASFYSITCIRCITSISQQMLQAKKTLYSAVQNMKKVCLSQNNYIQALKAIVNLSHLPED